MAYRLASQFHRSAVDFCHAVGQAVMGQLDAAAAETVGNDDIGTGFDIFAMNANHHLGRNKVHLLRTAAGLQATLLQQGAHGTVQHQYPFLQRGTKILHYCSSSDGGIGSSAASIIPSAGKASFTWRV